MKQRKNVSFEAAGHNITSWRIGDAVRVELEEWVPPDDTEGDWKNTGRGFDGTLVSGPQSVTTDKPEQQRYWYVLPPEDSVGDREGGKQHEGFYGRVHPVRFSHEAFDPYADIPHLAGEVSVRFTVSLIENSETAQD